MHEKDKVEWDLHMRFLVGNTTEITGCFDMTEGKNPDIRQKGYIVAIDTKGAAEGAIEFLLKSFYLGGKGGISKVLEKVRHNSAFPYVEI